MKFLSEEWAAAVMEAVNSTDEFAKAAGTASARLQQVITRTDGDAHYWTVVEDGKLSLGIGDLENIDATITQSYATAVALALSSVWGMTGSPQAMTPNNINNNGNMIRFAFRILPP
jgi:hypothetical protein